VFPPAAARYLRGGGNACRILGFRCFSSGRDYNAVWEYLATAARPTFRGIVPSFAGQSNFAMDSQDTDRPYYRSPAELASFETLNTPLWIFDVDRHAMWWGNQRALGFWRARDLDALLARDYSTDSETVRLRLRQIVESPVGVGRIQDTWTLYPDGIPTTIICDMQPVVIDDNRNAIMFEASRTLDFRDDPETLRIIEAARSSALMVSSFSMAGQLLTQNPASHACYANALAASGSRNLSSRFIDGAVSASILAAVTREGQFEGEFAVRTGRGERIHRVFARKGRDPVTGEFVTVLNEEDMTEQVTLRQRLQRLNDELESRVAERTERLQKLNENLAREIREREAAEEQLRHAQRMEAVGKLTGGVAHDFNNLLAVIIGNAELLEEQAGIDNEPLQSILRAATRGAEVTQRLLAFSRRQPLQPRAVDLGTLVRGMSGLLRRTLGETIDIRTTAEDGLWEAMADPGQVENALLNLALNARDAMPDGGTLSIACANRPLAGSGEAPASDVAPADYVVLSVGDNGAGMSEDVRCRAFEPFFTTKDVGKGSGLGLSMVYGFAKQSGGHAEILSAEGRGTTVNLFLPRAAMAAWPERLPPQDIPRGRNETILIIEDETDVRTLAVQIAESLGYRTVSAGTATQAERILSAGTKIDLVLTDVVLPGGTSGPEFAAQIRARMPTLKFVFMSGYFDELQHDGLIANGETLINKPFRRRKLAETLRRVLG
jgi:signal transduction histidine kinase/CheY-like chemotaxis protein